MGQCVTSYDHLLITAMVVDGGAARFFLHATEALHDARTSEPVVGALRNTLNRATSESLWAMPPPNSATTRTPPRLSCFPTPLSFEAYTGAMTDMIEVRAEKRRHVPVSRLGRLIDMMTS